MADDLESLVLSISADVRSVTRALNKLDVDVARNTRRVESRFNAMGANIERSSARAFGRIAGYIATAFGVQATQRAIDSSTRITNALKVAGVEGEKLKEVYETLYASAQRNAAPLESLVTLYGRAAIVQKELGVSSEELLKFTDNVALALRVAGTDAQSASGALLQLSQALGSGTVRAEEFNSILEGALPVAQAAAAGLAEAGGSVAKLRGLVIDGKVSSEAFFRAFEAGAVILEGKVANAQVTVSQGFTKIYNAAIDAAGKINEGSEAGKRLADSLDALALSIKDADFGPLVDGLTTAIKFAGILADTVERIERGAGRLGDMTGASQLGPWLRGDGRANQDGKGDMQPRSGVRVTIQPPPKPVSLGDFAAPTGSGNKDREDKWERETRQIQEATEALRLEIELTGQSEQARDKARAALELENAARQAGVAILPEHRARIDELTTAYAAAAQAAREAAEDQRRAEQATAEFYDTFKSSVTGAIQGTSSLGEALDAIKNKLMEMAVSGLLDMLFMPPTGGSGGGPLGGIFSAVGSLFGFSSGTPNTGGRRGQVRGVVHGQEAVIPLPNGGRVPVDLRGAPAADRQTMRSDPAVVTVAISAGEMFDARVASVAGPVSAEIVRRNNVNVPGLVLEKQRRS